MALLQPLCNAAGVKGMPTRQRLAAIVGGVLFFLFFLLSWALPSVVLPMCHIKGETGHLHEALGLMLLLLSWLRAC